MIILEPNKTVRDVVIENPELTRVFEKIGIDYCCGGERSLRDACQSAGVTLEDLNKSLTLTGISRDEKTDFRSLSLTELIDHILNTHHVFTRAELERLRELMTKVYLKHGQNHLELTQVKSFFEALSAELDSHMMKEERVLFPYVMAMEEAVSNQRTRETPLFGTVANPIRMMMFEHDNAGYILRQMRQLTHDYTPPTDACMSYRALYQALNALEKDLHQHIHLENNILFPRAASMEAAD